MYGRERGSHPGAGAQLPAQCVPLSFSLLDCAGVDQAATAAQAEIAVRDTFVIALNRLGRYHADIQFETWLYASPSRPASGEQRGNTVRAGWRRAPGIGGRRPPVLAQVHRRQGCPSCARSGSPTGGSGARAARRGFVAGRACAPRPAPPAGDPALCSQFSGRGDRADVEHQQGRSPCAAQPRARSDRGAGRARGTGYVSFWSRE